MSDRFGKMPCDHWYSLGHNINGLKKTSSVVLQWSCILKNCLLKDHDGFCVGWPDLSHHPQSDTVSDHVWPPAATLLPAPMRSDQPLQLLQLIPYPRDPASQRTHCHWCTISHVDRQRLGHQRPHVQRFCIHNTYTLHTPSSNNVRMCVPPQQLCVYTTFLMFFLSVDDT